MKRLSVDFFNEDYKMMKLDALRRDESVTQFVRAAVRARIEAGSEALREFLKVRGSGEGGQ